jgi:hypothetical protein
MVARTQRVRATCVNVDRMSRPTRFEHFRYLGDKRTQRVYDLDLADSDPALAKAIAELMASEQFAAFSPDTLAEARNRGYHEHVSIARAADQS